MRLEGDYFSQLNFLKNYVYGRFKSYSNPKPILMYIDIHSILHPKKFYDVGPILFLAFSHALILFL